MVEWLCVLEELHQVTMRLPCACETLENLGWNLDSTPKTNHHCMLIFQNLNTGSKPLSKGLGAH